MPTRLTQLLTVALVLALVSWAVSAAGLVALSPPAGAAESEGPAPDRGHPAIEDGLLVGTDAAGNGTRQTSDDSVRVVVEAHEGRGNATERAVAARGTVELRHGTLVRATVRRDSLEDLADEPAVRFVRRPYVTDQSGNYTSEGVETIDADVAHDRGWRGNVTVAVIDHGFDPEHDPIADNVVHTNDTTGYGIGGRGSDTTHGDGSAEIVQDVAPGVDLVLISAETGLELLNAIEYVDDNDWGDNGSTLEIDAVSMSLGLPGGAPLDGTARFDREIGDSVSNGTPWYVSSGNQAGGKHWNGSFNDTDGDSDHEFRSGDQCSNVSASGSVSVNLQWNDWPESDQDYDLELYEYTDSGLERVDASRNFQTGSQPPFERVSTGDGGDYCFKITSVDANGDADFDVFLRGIGALDTYTDTRSVVVPATGPQVTATGAVYYGDRSLRAFSSRGPTIDGRTKPDIVGPDSVSNEAYSPNRFAGTSAAAPHVAGSAALVLSANDSVRGIATSTRLTATADPITSDTPDNESGAGLVDAAAAVPPQNPNATTAPSVIDPDNASSVRVDVTFDHAPKPGTATVVLTDENGTTVENTTSLDTANRTTPVSVNATGLADGNVTVRARATDSTGWSNPGGLTAETTIEARTAPRLIDYTNENDVVDTDGLRDGIDDWRAGSIGTELLRDVIDFWRSGDVVDG